jgi:hypothetical protein
LRPGLPYRLTRGADIRKQEFGRIFHTRRQKEHAATTLGKPERPAIDHPVRPDVSGFLQLLGEETHACAPLQRQHEGNILK